MIRGDAARGEYFTFQIGVWAARGAITDLDVRFSDLVRTVTKTDDGTSVTQVLVPAKQMTCFSKGGNGWDGSPIKKVVSVDEGKIQALWCGFQVPASVRPGIFRGTVTVAPAGLPETILAVELNVTEEILADAGDGDPFRMTRLRWLDSTLAQDDEHRPALHSPHRRPFHRALSRPVPDDRTRRLAGPHPELLRARDDPTQAKPVDVTSVPDQAPRHRRRDRASSSGRRASPAPAWCSADPGPSSGRPTTATATSS